MVALRADRLGELSTHQVFARLIEPGVYLLGAMGEADLRAAIEGPAHQAGLLLEPGLVELLVQDVEGEPGALPLLSHALRTTWERREGRTLTVEGYRATGGIRGAVAQSAEALYEQVPADQRPLLRDLLLRLVTPSPDGQPVRNRVPRRASWPPTPPTTISSKSSSPPGSSPATTASSNSPTRPSPGPGPACRAGSTTTSRANASSATWPAPPTPGTRMGRPDSELYRGARLAQALDWRHAGHPRPHPHRAGPSSTPAEALADSRTAAPPRTGPATRPARTAGCALSSPPPPSSSSGRSSWASSPSASATAPGHEGRVATARELAAAANANVDVDPERSILLALEAVERTRSDEGAALPEAEEALHRAVTAPASSCGAGRGRPARLEPGRHRLRGGGARGVGHGRHPRRSNRRVAALGPGPRRRHQRCRVQPRRQPARHHRDRRRRPHLEPGHRRAAAQRRRSRLRRRFGVWGPSFSPDGSLFAAAWPTPASSRSWTSEPGRSSGRSAQSPAPGGTSFDPSGVRIAVVVAIGPTAVGRGRRVGQRACSP